MSEFKVSKVVLLVALVRFELENNDNVDAVRMRASTDDTVPGIKTFNIYITVNDNITTEIELEIVDSQIQAIIRTKKPTTGIDTDHITKVIMPLAPSYDVDAWKSMARDIVGMALKE